MYPLNGRSCECSMYKCWGKKKNNIENGFLFCSQYYSPHTLHIRSGNGILTNGIIFHLYTEHSTRLCLQPRFFFSLQDPIAYLTSH